MAPLPGYHAETAAIRWLVIGLLIGIGVISILVATR